MQNTALLQLASYFSMVLTFLIFRWRFLGWHAANGSNGEGCTKPRVLQLLRILQVIEKEKKCYSRWALQSRGALGVGWEGWGRATYPWRLYPKVVCKPPLHENNSLCPQYSPHPTPPGSALIPSWTLPCSRFQLLPQQLVVFLNWILESHLPKV